MHAPAWQVSVCEHPSPSLQLLPFALFGFEQVPVAVLHTPASWHWSSAVHVTGLAPMHAPAWHVSTVVQPFPSLHALPSARTGFEHTPVVESHTPAAWH